MQKDYIDKLAYIEIIDYFDYSQKSKTSPVDNLIFDDLLKKGLII